MSTWILEKKFRFEASHQLMHHDGKCANMHGHSWKGFIQVAADELRGIGPKENMVIDYGDLGTIVKDIEGRFDHRHLNEVLGVEMPTSELLAETIFGIVKNRLPEGVRLECVGISETENTQCIYTE